MKIKVLHIANDFLGSTVYQELYTKLAEEKVAQIVYCPLRSVTKKKSAFINEIPYQVVFSSSLKKYYKFLFKNKIRFLYNDIKKQIDFNEIDIIHATTWFSDGAVAYKLYKEYNIPYIVTVRNTDLNLFLKYMFHLRNLGVEILRKAEKIVFISPIYLKRFAIHPCIRDHFQELETKTKIIPNGISDFWIDNWENRKKLLTNPVQLLYIGKFSKGKNVDKLIYAIEELNSNNKNYVLNVVGGGGDKRGKVMQLVKDKDFVHYHGRIHDKQQLKALMFQCDIFTMPSKHETFGLVYIEALSQGIPVVYSQNEGIDGFFGKSIGEAVNPHEIKSIKKGIIDITNNYNQYKFNSEKIVEKFNWGKIAKQYVNIYKKSQL